MGDSANRHTVSDKPPDAPHCAADSATHLNSVDIMKGSKPPVFIGDATMDKDGTINLNLRRTADGVEANAQLHYKPDNKLYQEIYCHLGGIKPGQTKLVTPFEDPPPKKEKK
jgi:hypothetical protein